MEHFNWITGVLFPYMNFALFLFLAYKLFRDPVQGFAANRHAEYQKLVEEAQKAKALAIAEQDKLQAKLKSLDAEVATLKARAEDEARDEARIIVEEAKKLADHLRSEARRIAENELKDAKEALQKEVIESVRRNVAERLNKNLDANSQLDIVKNRIASIKHMSIEA